MKKLMIIAALAASTSFAVELSPIDQLVFGIGPSVYEAGEGVTTVRPQAFAENNAIVSISVPEAVSVGSGAFRGCRSLRSVDLRAVTDVSGFAGMFSGCQNLVEITMTSYVFKGRSETPGFPWGIVNRIAVFHFANGDFGPDGRRI